MIYDTKNIFGKAKKMLKNIREEVARNKAEKHKLEALGDKLLGEIDGSGNSKIDLTTASIAKATVAVLGIIALAYFLIAIKDVLILFFIAAFLELALDPFVDKMKRWRIPRGFGILIVYAVIIGFFGVIISSFVPILTTEIPKLATQILNWVSNFGIDTSVLQQYISQFQDYLVNIQSNLNRENITAGLNVLSSVGQNAFAVVGSIAGGLFSFIMILVIAFFMSVEEDGIKNFFVALFPKRFHKYINEKGSKVGDKFGAWVRGQIILMVVVGAMTYIALSIAGVNYAATLGTFSGLTELIPYVGPMIALIPAVILAASQGGFVLAIVVTAIYIGVQQLEGNVIVPLVMKKAVGLSPVVIMFAMLVGASFPSVINPVVGIIVSVPLATAISVFVHDWAEREK
ncbi:MAG: AI-2E family transporter [Candidatus Gracilibacteria bacterium]|nr:AI-2E family transporter [Candidatus Gracilibacteria bacterium]MDD5178993.1 AI-2E family transporter [Candidatus Gracilibacteria bacterium]